MNLCRVLPAGLEAKACVDAAVAACNAIGNLRGDILRCKQAAEASGSEEGERGWGGRGGGRGKGREELRGKWGQARPCSL